MSRADILEEIRRLPEMEQRDLVAQICREFGSDTEQLAELSPEQAAELDRRLAEFEANPGNGVPWPEVARKSAARIMTPNAVDTAELNLENIFRVAAVRSCSGRRSRAGCVIGWRCLRRGRLQAMGPLLTGERGLFSWSSRFTRRRWARVRRQSRSCSPSSSGRGDRSPEERQVGGAR